VQGPSEELLPFAFVSWELQPGARVGGKQQHAAAAADELLLSCMLWEQHHNCSGVLLQLASLLVSHKHGQGGGRPGR